ncbi:hypothetical protein D9756_010833 [Leucocoprinus leucothites]|uniref:DUF6534 domain-containing protein n=1 Tax=Leucocoprinus leucothites TaxID=201217 RepID=A0A8H5FQP6_9AGAR|nr:hypothetical protein D9756_010833 [Leucoagaricus leucothites]
MNPDPTVSNTIGIHLIGSFFAICLFGVVLVQIYHFFETFRDDKWSFKVLVSLLCLLEIGHSIGIVYDVYETNIVYDVRNSDLSTFKGSAFATALSGLITFLVQTFFAVRLFRLLPHPWRFIGPLCIVLSTMRLAGSLYVAHSAFISNSLSRFATVNDWLITYLLSIGAATDLIIATSMIYYLLKQRERALSKSSRVIDKLILWTVRSGLITSLFALGMLIAFQVAPRTLYSNSMVSNLNGRQYLRNALSGNTTIDLDDLSSGRRSTSKGFSPTSNVFKPGYDNHISIEMSTTTDVVVDSIPGSPIKPPSSRSAPDTSSSSRPSTSETMV